MNDEEFQHYIKDAQGFNADDIQRLAAVIIAMLIGLAIVFLSGIEPYLSGQNFNNLK